MFNHINAVFLSFFYSICVLYNEVHRKEKILAVIYLDTHNLFSLSY